MFVRFRMSWNFDLPVYALYGHTPLRTIMLLTFVNYPMTWWCNIFSNAFCNLAIHLLELSLIMSFPCDALPGISREWRWFVASTPNYASFHVVKHLRVFWGRRHKIWLENKVWTKFNWYLEAFKILIVCPPNSSFVHLSPIPNLSPNELVALKNTPKEAKYGDFGANA